MEGRSRVLRPDFVQSFLDSPRNLFKVRTGWLYTSLCAFAAAYVRRFAGWDFDQIRRKSVERLLYNYVHHHQVPHERVAALHVERSDSAKNRIVTY